MTDPGMASPPPKVVDARSAGNAAPGGTGRANGFDGRLRARQGMPRPPPVTPRIGRRGIATRQKRGRRPARRSGLSLRLSRFRRLAVRDIRCADIQRVFVSSAAFPTAATPSCGLAERSRRARFRPFLDVSQHTASARTRTGTSTGCPPTGSRALGDRGDVLADPVGAAVLPPDRTVAGSRGRDDGRS